MCPDLVPREPLRRKARATRGSQAVPLRMCDRVCWGQTSSAPACPAGRAVEVLLPGRASAPAGVVSGPRPKAASQKELLCPAR